jgi:hypothetical protein
MGYHDPRTRMVVWIPRELNAQVRQLALLTGRSRTTLVIRGLRLVLREAQKTWPKEYLNPEPLEEREHLNRSMAALASHEKRTAKASERTP